MADSTLLLQDLLGRRVVDASGHRLGRVVECLAEPQGDELRITALLVGPGAWAGRYAWRHRSGGHRVPWRDIASLQPHITLVGSAMSQAEGRP